MDRKTVTILFFVFLNLYAFAHTVFIVNTNAAFSSMLESETKRAEWLASKTDWETFDERGIGGITLKTEPISDSIQTQLKDGEDKVVSASYGEKEVVLYALGEKEEQIVARPILFSSPYLSWLYQKALTDKFPNGHLLPVWTCLLFECAIIIYRTAPPRQFLFPYILARIAIVGLSMAAVSVPQTIPPRELCLMIGVLWLLSTQLWFPTIFREK